MKLRNLCLKNLLCKECRIVGRENKQHYCKSIYNVAGVLSILISCDGSIIEVDQSVYDRTGFSQKDLVNRNINETLFQLEEREKRNLRFLLSESAKFRFKLRINLKNGNQNEYMGLFERCYEYDNNFILCFLVPEDQNKKKNLHIEIIAHLERSNNYLKKKVELLKEEKNYICHYASNKFEISVRPFIDEIKRINKNRKTDLYLKIIEDNLVDILYRNQPDTSAELGKLTSNENAILQFIKQGKSSKEIAEILNITLSTVSYHRHNIRKKIGLNKKRTSLSSYVKNSS